MSEPTRDAGGSADSLTSLFNLGDEQRHALASLFETVGDETGFNPARIFDALDKGESLQAAMGLPDAAIDMLYAQAFARFNSGKSVEAENLFRALCLLRGDRVDHWLGHGICLRMNQRLDEAATAFTIANQLRPDLAAPLFHMLELMVHTGELQKAKQLLAALGDFDTDALGDAMRREIQRYRLVVEKGGDAGSAAS